MRDRDYVIAFALRTGIEERTLRLSHDEFLWFQRLFKDSMRLAHGEVCAEIRPVGTPRSASLQAPSEPKPSARKHTRRRSSPFAYRNFDMGGAA